MTRFLESLSQLHAHPTMMKMQKWREWAEYQIAGIFYTLLAAWAAVLCFQMLANSHLNALGTGSWIIISVVTVTVSLFVTECLSRYWLKNPLDWFQITGASLCQAGFAAGYIGFLNGEIPFFLLKEIELSKSYLEDVPGTMVMTLCLLVTGIPILFWRANRTF